jgi:hypothetical protein
MEPAAPSSPLGRHTTPTPTRAGKKDESARGRESEPVSLETERLARVRGLEKRGKDDAGIVVQCVHLSVR